MCHHFRANLKLTGLQQQWWSLTAKPSTTWSILALTKFLECTPRHMAFSRVAAFVAFFGGMMMLLQQQLRTLGLFSCTGDYG